MLSFSVPNNNVTSLKLSFNGEIRRLSVNPQGLTYKDLLAKTLSVFPKHSALQFSWVDDENDKVVISSNEELSEALRIMACEKKGYLRFEVLTSTKTTPEASGTDHSSHQPTAAFGIITHVGVTCNECGLSPVTGARYKCAGRDNYDICEACESLHARARYPKLKIYHPSQLPAGMSVFLEEKRGSKHNAGCHRGIVCNGCNARNFQGPRFKCTVRNDFDLCQHCEPQHNEHMMVKMYPQHDRMTVHIVAESTAHDLAPTTYPPPAACHFRHSGHDHKQRPGKGRNYWLKNKSSSGKYVEDKDRGRHCWDRSSVARAAAKRAKDKAIEAAYFEDQIIEMSMKESLRETERVVSCAPTPPETTVASKISEQPCKRGGHCWDRKSVKRAAAQRAEKFVQGCHQWKHVAMTVDEQPTHLRTTLVHNWERAPVQNTPAKRTDQHMSVITEMKKVQELIKSKHPQTSLLDMYSKAKEVKEKEEKKDKEKASPMIDALLGSSVALSLDQSSDSLKRTHRPSDTIANTFKQGVKWDISASDSCSVHTLVPTPLVASTTQDDTVRLNNVADHIQLEKKEKQFNHDVSAWSNELKVLGDMGFSCYEQLLPLLKTHVGTPASAKGLAGTQLSEQGLQAVVLYLVSSDGGTV